MSHTLSGRSRSPRLALKRAKAAVSPELEDLIYPLSRHPHRRLERSLLLRVQGGVSADDEPYIVYVSAETGEEINILKNHHQ